MSKWFYIADGIEIGPVAPPELKGLANSGRIKPSDKVRRESMTTWVEAKNVVGLFD